MKALYPFALAALAITTAQSSLAAPTTESAKDTFILSCTGVENLDGPDRSQHTSEAWQFDGTTLTILLDGHNFTYKPDITKILLPKIVPSNAYATYFWRIGFIGPVLQNNPRQKEYRTIEIAHQTNETTGKEIFGIIDSDGGYVEMAKGHYMRDCTYLGTGALR